jgi:hypothetical protein
LGWLAEQGKLLQQDMPIGATARHSASAKAQERRTKTSLDLDLGAFIIATVFRLPAQDGMVNPIAPLGTG